MSLIIHSRKPFNVEPDLASLRASAVTAQADFYVRSHGTTPSIDADTYLLDVSGLVEKWGRRSRLPQTTRGT